MMKKLLLAFFTVIATGLSMQAIKPELQVGYGGYTQMDACNMHQWGEVKNAWGALTAGVNFQLMPKLKVGASYTFSSASYKESGNAYYHVIMLNGRYDYWRNSIVTLYGHLGAGIDITHSSAGDYHDNSGYFAFQVSPVGAEVGLSRNTAMFGELGFGAQGLLQVGFRLRL